MAKIRAILFDLDGVLIEAKEWHYEALNEALRLFAYEISRKEHVRFFDGLPTNEKLKVLTRDFHFPKGLHSTIHELKQTFTVREIKDKCKPIEQHHRVMQGLKKAGYRLAICSNSIRSTLDLMVEKAALQGYMEFTLSNQDVMKPKPDPEIYNVAAGRMGLKTSECLILEDSQHGIAAAKASGAHVFTVNEVYDVELARIQERISAIERAS